MVQYFYSKQVHGSHRYLCREVCWLYNILIYPHFIAFLIVVTTAAVIVVAAAAAAAAAAAVVVVVVVVVVVGSNPSGVKFQ